MTPGSTTQYVEEQILTVTNRAFNIKLEPCKNPTSCPTTSHMRSWCQNTVQSSYVCRYVLYDQTAAGFGDIAEVYSNANFTYSTLATLQEQEDGVGTTERGDAAALDLAEVSPPSGMFLVGQEPELLSIVESWSALMVCSTCPNIIQRSTPCPVP